MRSTQIVYFLFSAAGLWSLSSTAFAQNNASAPQKAVTVSVTHGSFKNINIRGVGNSSTNPAVTTGVAVIRDGLHVIETNALGLPLYETIGAKL
jgi:hypothetical protein